MAKDIIILCLDVGPSMSLDPLAGGETPLEKSVKIASQIAQQKMFAGSKDLLGLVLFGTPDTDNALASADESGGYQNITVPYQPAPPMIDFLQFLNTSVKPGGVSADFIDAIVVAMDILVTSLEDIKRVGTKKIYLMTDAGSEYSDSQLDQICAGLKQQEIELIIVGPTISSAGGGGGGDNPPNGEPRPSYPPSSSMMKKTPQQVAGEAVISRLVAEVDGLCFSFNEALQKATFIHKNAKKQTTRFAGHLEIGNRLKIPCKIFTKVMVERPDTWKKLSAVSQATANNGTMAVKMPRSYHLNDEDETEVEMENIVKGYRYGKSLIPISEDDEIAMKFPAPRCLSLMGFTKRENVRQHQFIGTSVQVLTANPDDQNASRALSAFIHALYETNRVGVVRYVWRKDTQPKLIALVPDIKAESECLLMVQLPFMEDVRQFVFGSIPGERKNAAPSDEQLNAVDGLISNMDLMTADMDEEGNKCEALKPKMICNPIIQRTFQCIAHRALNPEDPLPEMEDSLKHLLQSNPTIVAGCRDNLQRIKDLFPLEKVERKRKEDGAVTEVWKKTSDLDLDSDAPLAKRPREDQEEINFSMASLARGNVTKVGTLDPVSDYQRLIKTNDFVEVSRQLQAVTMDLVKESFGDTLYGKAMDCIKGLRNEAMLHFKPDVFNMILQEIKDNLIGTRYSPFWKMVASEGVTLISNAESDSSAITQEQAVQFIQASLVTADTAPPVEEDTDDPDNLLELM